MKKINISVINWLKYLNFNVSIVLHTDCSNSRGQIKKKYHIIEREKKKEIKKIILIACKKHFSLYKWMPFLSLNF